MRVLIGLALLGLAALAAGLPAVGARAQESPPGLGGSLRLEALSASGLTVTWSWSGRAGSAFEVAWRARGDDDEAAAWRSVRKDAAERRHVITELDAGVHYVVRVRGLDADDRPIDDLRGVFATSWSAPRLLRVIASDDGALTVSWAQPSDWTPQGWRLNWRVAGSQTAGGTIDLPAAARSRRIDGLTTGADYRIRLTALNSRGGESPAQTLRATAADAGPATPRLTALSWSGLTIRAEWQPVPRASGYDLFWRAADERGGAVGRLSAQGTSAEFAVPAAGVYRVEVRALSGAGRSAAHGDRSPPRSIAVRPAPAELRVLSFDGEYVHLTWPAVGAERYAVEWGERGGAVRTALRAGGAAAGAAPTLALGPLAGGKTYEFRVRARNDQGGSAPSPPATLTPTRWPETPPPGLWLFVTFNHRSGGIDVTPPAVAGAPWYEAQWVNYQDDAERGRARSSGAERRVRLSRAGGFENGLWLIRVRAGPWGTWSTRAHYHRVIGQPPRLALALESSRDLCTAGTLTEISWQISGGSAPYALSIEGSAVDVSADNVRINCGALSETEAADAEAGLAAKTITATVTDSRGVRREAALDVARARALPALPPTRHGDAVWAYRGELGFEWLVPATPYDCREPNCFAIRWRAVGSEGWTYAPLTYNLGEENSAFGIARGLADGVTYEAAAAAMRDPIELETPAALRWTAPLSGTTLTDPTGLTATATHDTVTVRWNRQPTAKSWSVYLRGPDGGLSEYVRSWNAASWGDPESGVHEVSFRHLPSSTRFTAGVAWNPMEGYRAARAETTVETLALPAGREPLKRGPQNLRATPTRDSITVMWDQPFEGANDPYWVFLFRSDYPYRASQTATVRSPDTQFTFNGLESGETYRIIVRHRAIVRASDEISATTNVQPPSEDSAAGASAGQQSSTDEWPLSGTFQPVWPHALLTATNKWGVLTDDAWIARSNRWHGGIDTGLSPSHGAERRQIQAVAEGILREYDPERQGFVLFCPGSSTSPHLADQVQVSKTNNVRFGEGASAVNCTELANIYHGRVAFTFHEYADVFYVVQYAHLSRFGTASESRMEPSMEQRRVKAGTPIGIEGRTGAITVNRRPMWSETAYDPHLHMTIRVFTHSDATDEVADTVGGNWRALALAEDQNWSCGDATMAPTHCGHSERRIDTMVDPEEVLPPGPPAASETGPKGKVPLWNSENHAGLTYGVNNPSKRFLLRSIDVEAEDQVDVDIDVAVWRPRLYTYDYKRNPVPKRYSATGLAGTRDGVQGYFASAGDCGPIVTSDPGDQIAFTNVTSGRKFWSEVAPMRLTVTLEEGRNSCDVSVGSYNESYPPGAELPDGAYGRDAAGDPYEPQQLTARVSMYGTVLEPSASEAEIPNESLAAFEFRLYEFEAILGHTYEFKTAEVGEDDDVVLELWQGGQPLGSTANGPGPATLSWEAVASGTAHVVARGGVGTTPWTGDYELKYRRKPLPKLTVTVRPTTASCYTNGTVSIRWTVSGGTSPYSAKVNGGAVSGNRMSKTVACRRTITVSATDSSTPQLSGSTTITLTVSNPPSPPLHQWRECLTNTTPGTVVTYRGLSGCGPVLASLLTRNVRAVRPEVCGIRRWRNGEWGNSYFLPVDGHNIPGSQDFTINVGDTLALYRCELSGAAGATGAEASGDFLEE